MELIYVWVEDLLPFEKHTSIKLSNRFDITPNVDLDAKSIKLDIKDNKDFIPNFFGDKVANVTAIVGKNGTGKTCTLEFLINLLTETASPQNYGKYKYLALFFDEIKHARSKTENR